MQLVRQSLFIVLLQASLWWGSAFAFQGFQLPKISFPGNSNNNPASPAAQGSSSIAKQKQALLEAVSNTNNGKTATPEQQKAVLEIVSNLEAAAPAPVTENLLSDTNLAKQYIDGVWYLQYTSPSVVGDDDQFPDAWKPVNAAEGDSNIATNQIKMQGSITAVGINVDTSNKVVQQIFNVDEQRVENYIEQPWGNVRVAGAFRQSPSVPNRAIVAFDTALIQIGGGDDGDGALFTINLNGVWKILEIVRRSKDTGWLETTFIDDTLRIGRGNKGTMFVLTRDPDAVTP